MLRALHDAALKARITRLGDPPCDRGHIQVDLPLKGRSRFVVMDARDDTGRMVWRLLWDGNEGEAGRRRHRIAFASDAYSRRLAGGAQGRGRAPGRRRTAARDFAPATPSAHTLHPALPGGPLRLTVPFLAVASLLFAADAQPVPPAPAPGDVRAQKRMRHDGAAPAETTP